MNEIHLLSGCVLVVMGLDDYIRYRDTGRRQDLVYSLVSTLLGLLNLTVYLK